MAGTDTQTFTSGSKFRVKLVRGPFVRLTPHPDALESPDDLVKWTSRISQPKVADLFCGAGGLGLGLEAAGFRVVCGVDNDPEALETHRNLFSGLSLDWDLADPRVLTDLIDLLGEAGVDLVAGGPPCQPFSRAGRSKIRSLVADGTRPHVDHRRDLWQSFLEVVAGVQPGAVLMENVPDMALQDDLLVIRHMVAELEELGYSVCVRLVDAWRHGVPQLRQRLLMVALADRVEFSWPAETDEYVTVDNAIGDLPPVEGGWRPEGGADGWTAYEGPRTEFQKWARRGVPADHERRVYDHITRPVREDDRQAFAQMDSSTSYADLPEELRRYRSDIFDDKYKRLDANDISRSITAHIAKDGYWYIHPTQDRTLTIREAARLQTFPDRVRFAGPPSAAFRQIGNAVPPRLAEHIGGAILTSADAGEQVAVTTSDTSVELATWFRRRELLTVPWLDADTAWSAIQAEMLLGRSASDTVRSVWPIIESWTGPAVTIEETEHLTKLATWMGHAERADRILEAAKAILGNTDLLESSRALAKAPHVGEAVARLALLVDGNSSDLPLIVSHGTLRVAARWSGLPVDKKNRMSDGRLVAARMVGAGEVGIDATKGLVELAASTCLPKRPECPVCPLRPTCAAASAVGTGAQTRASDP